MQAADFDIGKGAMVPDGTADHAVGMQFRCHPAGDHERASSVSQVQARFAMDADVTFTPTPPTLYSVSHYFGSDSDCTDGRSDDVRTARPWRCDVRGNAAWHRLDINVQTDGTAASDPELMSLAYNSDIRDAGRGQS